MTGFVTVEWYGPGRSVPERCGAAAGGLTLNVLSPEGRHVLHARAGRAQAAPDPRPRAGARGPGECVVDEHVLAVVDGRTAIPADAVAACADVVVDLRPCPPRDARRRLAEAVAARPGCRVAAVRRRHGGWAVLAGSAREYVLLEGQPPTADPLFASCLHAWLAAGRPLEELVRAGVRP